MIDVDDSRCHQVRHSTTVLRLHPPHTPSSVSPSCEKKGQTRISHLAVIDSSLEVILHDLVASGLVCVHVVLHHVHECILVERFVFTDLINLAV